MTFSHGASLAERWPTFSFAFQMANVGTDVSRAVAAIGNPEKSRAALGRALELLTLTITNASAPRQRELCRVREALAASYAGVESPIASLDEIDRYFQPFAFTAAMERRPKQQTP